MSKSSARSAIRLRGVRHNNLKNFDLDLPLNQLIVVTGLSGSGKSSLAFDTLFAEGQRRYIETFSPYARQFFDRMDKPQVDSIEGIPPAIAIEQRNAVKTTRSTVGTMTEICDYMKLFWPHIAQLHCRQCGQLVCKDSPQQIWAALNPKLKPNVPESRNAPIEVLITFELPLTDKLPLADSLALVAKQGYQRLLIGSQITRLDDLLSNLNHHAARITSLTVIQDRVKLLPENRGRFVEACEQAYHFGKGKLTVFELSSGAPTPSVRNPHFFSNRFHCAQCDIEYREPSPALFSFNHPVGACPTCKGFGRVISIDYDLAIPDRSKTLAEGVVKPWLTGQGAESQIDLLRACRKLKVPIDVPFEKLPQKWQDFVIEGEPGYGQDEEHEWPRAWYGVKGYFRWLESKAYKMHVRVLLSRYRAYTLCPDCKGARFQPQSLLYRFRAAVTPQDSSAQAQAAHRELTLADFYQLPLRDALRLVEIAAQERQAKPGTRANDPIALIFEELRSRLGFLNAVGLGYLTLDRPTRSLSGGETERVNLTTCLGTRLVNTLFVLDEPSVGLHPRDTERLVHILEQLRDAGNTVVVVEHEASVMRAANQIVDIGPGHGATGGQVVFQGSYGEILNSDASLTGQYLSGRKQIEIPERRPVGIATAASVHYGSSREPSPALALNDLPAPIPRTADSPSLKLTGASRHNLQNVSVEIPLKRFVAITGVSGSGKTTLIRELLLPALEAKLKSQIAESKLAKASERFENGAEESNAGVEETDADAESGSRFAPRLSALTGSENISRVVLVDQSILGKTPRSNPAVYIGAFDDIREVFAQSELAKQRGLNASAFSFNSAQGQCERCRGAGFEKIEMQFLSDVFIRCPDCNGRRYRPHILEIKCESPAAESANRSWSIADVLDATADEAIEFLSGFADSKPAQRAVQSVKLLQEVGLGYLRLGQPINTLSGGESQRLKLVRHLAEAAVPSYDGVAFSMRHEADQSESTEKTSLFLFDEPTTGLHFDDVRVLLKVFQRLTDAGHSVLVIEHNLDVIKSADWVIDLGPGAGDEGGQIVAQGTPEQIAACAASQTGQALKTVLIQTPESNSHEKNTWHRTTRRRNRSAG
ncbi:MAG: excinuclease ABC subunit UvrA [Verrucomicrobiota bacterium]